MPSDASSVTIPASGTISAHANFPAGSRHVVVVIQARDTIAAAADFGLWVRVNGDSNTKYDTQRQDGAVGTASAFKETGQTKWTNLCAYSGDTQDAGFLSPTVLLFPYAFNTANFKSVVSVNGIGEQRVRQGVGVWEDTSALTDVTVLSGATNLDAGTTVALYVVDESYLVSSGEEIISGSAAAFSDVTVPADDGDISIITYLRSSRSSTNDGTLIELNGDATGTNYNRQYLYGATSSMAAGSGNDAQIGGCNGATADANHFAPGLTSVHQHNQGDNDPYVSHAGGHISVTAADGLSILAGARRNNVAAVTSVNHTPGNSSTWEVGSGQWVYHVPKVLVERKTITSDTASVTFDLTALDIPSGVTDLRILIYARSDRTSNTDNVDIELNSDTTLANYDRQLLVGYSSTVLATQSAADNRVGNLPAASQGANEFGGSSIYIFDYNSSVKQKHILTVHGADEQNVGMTSVRWENTAAITSIVLKLDAGDNFIDGSFIELEAVGSLDPNSDNYVRQRLEASSTNVTAHEVAAA